MADDNQFNGWYYNSALFCMKNGWKIDIHFAITFNIVLKLLVFLTIKLKWVLDERKVI